MKIRYNNGNSILGKLLNPDYQNITKFIVEMPRMWLKPDRIRGVALSRDRFQFFFKIKADMEEILDNAVYCFNEWAIIFDRWVEHPPNDYLKFMPVWVQMKNIPVYNYTLKTIEAFGEFAGRVVETLFDPTKLQREDYIRVRVMLDVTKPMRRFKVITLPSKAQIIISYFYEKI